MNNLQVLGTKHTTGVQSLSYPESEVLVVYTQIIHNQITPIFLFSGIGSACVAGSETRGLIRRYQGQKVAYDILTGSHRIDGSSLTKLAARGSARCNAACIAVALCSGKACGKEPGSSAVH
ncbi:uncharacterized protein MCYG_08691 [Microsporum canis CBS 113480]|uniref:Uncharacterized protein n=1 Tax=Arthroderma otae (strain ATCC MYA-4605 / CBS 113480) TaxID=554155 RepID=C5G169_ARTOC|nr:uncharacterized protein MCYG_08691 [Microsporum canis CBS 113480]EEQ35872.1 predicted protein [Microsporum canis CBS 113480]